MNFTELTRLAAGIYDLACAKELPSALLRYRIQEFHEDESQFPTHEQEAVVWQQLRIRYADVPSYFAPLAEMPTAAQFETVLNYGLVAVELLATRAATIDAGRRLIPGSSDLTKMELVAALLAEWTGGAADEFRDNFLRRFPAIASGQFALAVMLRDASTAHADIWGNAWADAETIAQATVDALNQLPHKHDKQELVLTVIGAVAGVLGAPVSGTVAVTWALVAGASATAALGVPEDPPPGVLGGDNVDEVIDNMRGAITELINRVIREEDRLAEWLVAVVGEVDRYWNDFYCPETKLASASAATVTSDEFLGSAS